tara:strand:+ start:42 stop:1577 length:1536 start_codon:yes stop_codon:yes gene_type:complete
MPLQRDFFSIPATNELNTYLTGGALNGGFNFSKGNNVAHFSIPAQERMLPTQAMFLTGQMIVCGADGVPLSDRDGISIDNGADLTKIGNLNISNWGGVQNTIDKVMIQSKKSPVELINVNNYGMYQNIKSAYQSNDKDFLVSPLTRQMSSGKDAVMNRHNLVQISATAGASPDMPNIDNILDENFGQFFSFRLDTSLTNMRRSMNLSQAELGGLLITIHFKDDKGVFYRNWEDMDLTAGGQPDSDISGVFYRLKNLRLEGYYEIPSQQEMQNYQSMLVMNDRVNLIDTVISSNNITNYTPQLQNVKSFVNLFLDDNQQNNIERNESNYRVPLGLVDYSQNKNNIRSASGQDYLIEVKPSLGSPSSDDGTAYNPADLQFPSSGQGDAEVRALLQRAILDGRLANKSVGNLKLSDEAIKAEYASRVNTQNPADPTNGCIDNRKANVMGIGLDYGNGVNNVSNFVNQDYSLRLNCQVAAGNTDQPAQRRDRFGIQETFIRNLSGLNTQTLQKTM